MEILDTQIEVKDKKWAKKLKNIKWDIVFKNLEFSYDGKRKVLQDIHIDIKAGEKIAFVGHTGSGQTTMTNMLLRNQIHLSKNNKVSLTKNQKHQF